MAESATRPSAAETVVLPAVTVPNVLVFPGLMAPLLVDRPMGIAAVESAASQNQHLALFWSREPDDFDAAAEVGVAARILRLVRSTHRNIDRRLYVVRRKHVCYWSLE